MKPVVKKVNRRERLMPVKNEPCFERKAIMLSGCCPSGDRGIGKVGSEIELCSATFLRGVAHPKSPLTERVTLEEIEDSHSMMEVNRAVTGADADARADGARAAFRHMNTIIIGRNAIDMNVIGTNVIG